MTIYRQRKLTHADALEIKRRREAGELCKLVAQDFGISTTSVSLVARGKQKTFRRMSEAWFAVQQRVKHLTEAR